MVVCTQSKEYIMKQLRYVYLATFFFSTAVAETTLTISEFNIIPISCDDSIATSIFSLSAIGGVLPYFYQIDNEEPIESNQESFTFENISQVGSHTFTVRDSSSQLQRITSTVGPSDFTSITGAILPPCSKESNGRIILSMEGGMVPVTATLTRPNDTTEKQIDESVPFNFLFEDLRAGDYSLVLTSGPVDPNDIAEFIKNKYCCPPIMIELSLPDSDPLRIITPIGTTPETTGQSNGTITVETTGGVTVMYSIDNGETFQESNEFTGIIAGSYKVVTRSGIDPIFCFSDSRITVVELIRTVLKQN